MPQKAKNGIKMNHLHYHVFPRLEQEDNLFPTPTPNSFDGFTIPTDTEVLAVADLTLSISPACGVLAKQDGKE